MGGWCVEKIQGVGWTVWHRLYPSFLLYHPVCMHCFFCIHWFVSTGSKPIYWVVSPFCLYPLVCVYWFFCIHRFCCIHRFFFVFTSSYHALFCIHRSIQDRWINKATMEYARFQIIKNFFCKVWSCNQQNK